MKKILVTGGAGFIGSHTVVALCESSYEPIIVDDLSNSSHNMLRGVEKIIGKKPIFYKFDYKDPNKLKDVLANHKIDAVIHFAAFKSVDESLRSPLKYYSNNVSGLIDLLKLLSKFEINKFVFSSSATVYGESDKFPITEEQPLKEPTSAYGATKQMGERILKDSVSSDGGLSAVSLRYFNPVGAHHSGLIGELPIGRPANLVPFITQVAAGLRDKLTIYGNDYPTNDGTCIRDYIHVMDLARAHVCALDWLSNKAGGVYDVFNIGTGHGNSVMELINTFQKVNDIELNYEFGPRRPGDIVRSYASNSKARKILNWSASKSIEDSMRDAWNWQNKLKAPKK